MEKYKNKYRIASHRKPNWDYSADALYFLTIVTQHRICNLGKIILEELEGREIDNNIIPDHGIGTNNNIVPTPSDVTKAVIQLSDFGVIVEQEWFKSFEIRDELFLHDFVIMPNHIHTVVEICNPQREHIKKNMDTQTVTDNETVTDDETGNDTGNVSGNISGNDTGNVSVPDTGVKDTHGRRYLQNLSTIKRNRPIRLPKSISSFIAGFKSNVNTQIDNYIDLYHLPIEKYNRNNHFFQPNYHDHIIRNHEEYYRISNYIANNPMNWYMDAFYS